MAHRAADVLDATLAGERPVGRTIEEALAVLGDGDPDVEDELVAQGSLWCGHRMRLVVETMRRSRRLTLATPLNVTGALSAKPGRRA